MKMINKIGFLLAGTALAVSISIISQKTFGVANASPVKWQLIDDISDITNGKKYAITFDGHYLIPGAYPGISPLSGTFDNETALWESTAWTFINVGENQWHITDGTNWIRNTYNGPGGLRTQTDEPTMYWTAAMNGASINLISSFDGNRQISYYSLEDDWRTLAGTSTGNELQLYQYIPSLESIEVKTAATQLTFPLDEVFNYDGLVINAVYDDETVSAINSGFIVSGIDTSVLGSQTATITYEGITVDYDVRVTLNGTLTADLDQATAFATAVMTGVGNNAAGHCTAVLNELNEEYGYLSFEAKELFNTSEDELFVNARLRFAYLTSWVGSSSGSGQLLSLHSASNVSLVVVFIALGCSILLGGYFLFDKKRKEKHH